MPPKGSGKPRIIQNEEGLQIEVDTIKKGTGKSPVYRDICYIDYVGYLENGKKFDASLGQKPFKFAVGYGNVIEGLDIAVRVMSKGERAVIKIPPQCGYGALEQPGIPPNSTLVFDATLVEVEREPTKWRGQVKEFFQQLVGVLIMYGLVFLYMKYNRDQNRAARLAAQEAAKPPKFMSEFVGDPLVTEASASDDYHYDDEF